MKIRPILNKIIVKLQDPEKETTGGIIIASAKNEGVVEGDVIAVGPGAHDDKGKFIEVNIEAGSKILLNAGAGAPLKYEDEEYVVIVEEEVIAVLS